MGKYGEVSKEENDRERRTGNAREQLRAKEEERGREKRMRGVYR